MKLTIIIVSWNVKEHLKRCLESIKKSSPAFSSPFQERLGEVSREREDISFEVFVVDNASTDGTQEQIANRKSSRFHRGSSTVSGQIANFYFIQNDMNRGFAAANNQALWQAQGEYVLLLNPDTEFLTDSQKIPLTPPLEKGETTPPFLKREDGRDFQSSIKRMIDFMNSHPRCGILGPKLLNSDGSLQPSVRRFPDAWSPILLSLGLRIGPARRYLALNFDYTKAQQVDQVMGACFLIRKKVLEEIGLLDERFFIWFEEVDFCKRARQAGWEVWYTPDAEVVHHGGQSFAQRLTLQKQWWYSKSLLYYFRKHGQWFALLVNALITPFRLFFALLF